MASSHAGPVPSQPFLREPRQRLHASLGWPPAQGTVEEVPLSVAGDVSLFSVPVVQLGTRGHWQGSQQCPIREAQRGTVGLLCSGPQRPPTLSLQG